MTRLRQRLLQPVSDHWMALGLLALGLFCAFGLVGFVDHQIGSTSTHPTDPPVGLGGAGPVVDLSHPEAKSVGPAADEIALTFDDGPDGRWTPEVLAVLARHRVPATFFVTGHQVLEHPGLVQRLIAEGHEVGSHGFTHIDLGSAPGLRVNLELTLTETALAGAVGRTTSLLRMPYTSGSDSLTEGQIEAARRAARYGYLLVTSTHDPDDWRRPGIEAIVRASTPVAGQGAVVLLHDGGGERSQTVEALDRYIARMTARGYRFVTISQMAHLDPGAVAPKVGTFAHWQGLALIYGLTASRAVVYFLTALLVPVGILAAARTLIVVGLAGRHRRRRSSPPPGPAPDGGVSVIIPAFNEEVGIEACVRSVLASDHRPIEVVVVDDGSTDDTAAIVAALNRDEVTLVRQPNRGKAAALNAGIARSRYDTIVMIDGDTIVARTMVGTLAKRLTEPGVGGVSGNAKVGNRRRFLGRWQHIEYVMGFNLDRRMYDQLRCVPTVPGASGGFRREALVAVGGVSGDTLAEDTDLTMAVLRQGWREVYEPEAVAWTEAPSSLGALWRQRYRWSYGTLQAIWKHRHALREGGRLGWVAIPYMLFFQILLPLLAPVIDVMAVYGLVFLDAKRVIAYWLGFMMLQLISAAYAFRLDRERLRPLWALPLQQFVYRQLMYLVVIQSIVTAVTGARLGWHKQKRSGIDAPVQEPALTVGRR